MKDAVTHVPVSGVLPDGRPFITGEVAAEDPVRLAWLKRLAWSYDPERDIYIGRAP